MSSIWDLYNLSGNPFFRDPLGEELRDRLPSVRELFVGRDDDVAPAIRPITHDSATRTVIIGAPGIGKTTLLNLLRAELDATAGPTDLAMRSGRPSHRPMPRAGAR